MHYLRGTANKGMVRDRSVKPVSRLPHFHSFRHKNVNQKTVTSDCACGGVCPRCGGLSPIQTKLTVGSPKDKHEREADRVAEYVARTPEMGGPQPAMRAHDRRPVKPLGEGSSDVVYQTIRTSGVGADDGKRQNIMPGSANGFVDARGGTALSKSIRSRIEPVLGADLSHVRVHSGIVAQEASDALNARAFTNKSNIFLGKGQSASDVRLMAHECTHVVQQHNSSPTPTADIQRDVLSEQRLPSHTPFTPAQEANLIPLVQAYLNAPSVSAGRATVAAVESLLEAAGTVQYNRPEVSRDSPRFTMRPSMAASQIIGSGNTEAGLTFGGTNGIIKVEIYPRAFTGSNPHDSLGFLTGVLIHEYIHVLQNIAGPNGSNAGVEFQAWLWQAEHLSELGITAGTGAAGQIASQLRHYFDRLIPAERTGTIQARFNNAMNALRPASH